jgi:16S rRNA (cytosine967-C5)-methyltransferase
MSPRKLAFSLLQKAETNDQYLNIALDHALEASSLSELDRALAATLVYGVTERKITLDYQIERLSSRPTEELDLSVKTALRLGLYQLAYLDRIPAHAAVDESVSLVTRRASGFVNAILRAYTRDPHLCFPEREDGIAAYLSVAYSVGLPLVNKLLAAYGEDTAEEILRGFSQPPHTTISVNTLKISRDALAKKLAAESTALAPNGLKVRGSIRALDGFSQGEFFVQDEASQLCVEALGAEAGELILDLCSAPGSKSFGSAIRMKNKGRILSFDLHEKKLSLIRTSARRLGIDIIEAQHTTDAIRSPSSSSKPIAYFVTFPARDSAFSQKSQSFATRIPQPRKHFRAFNEAFSKMRAATSSAAVYSSTQPARSSPKKTKKTSEAFLTHTPSFRSLPSRSAISTVPRE